MTSKMEMRMQQSDKKMLAFEYESALISHSGCTTSNGVAQYIWHPLMNFSN